MAIFLNRAEPALSLSVLAWIAAVGIGGCGDQRPAATDIDTTLARSAIAEYATALKHELTTALADGPIAAVDVCKTSASAIASEVGEKHGVIVARTALKVRNPDNSPGDWQRRTLESFAAAIAAGQAPDSLAATNTYVVNGRRRNAYMKPIMTAPLCVLCHGATIDADLEAHIISLYPDDQARGFATGDLRGAFVVSWDTQ